MCPGFDSTDILEKFQCGNCLEIPEFWQEIRKCTFRYIFFYIFFRYEFVNNTINTQNNLLNYSTIQPNLYKI